MTAPARSPARRPWLIALAPATIGLVLGVVLLLADPPVRVQVSAPPATIAVIVGLVLTAIALVFLMIRRHLTRARQQSAADTAQQAQADHRRFLARLDHELKNPITAIRAAVAAQGVSDSPHLAAVDAQSTRLAALVGDLRKLSDLQSSPLEREPVDLHELATDAAAAVRQQVAVTGGGDRDLHVQFPQAPWQVPPVSADPDLLYLAVYNILSNAAKFTRDGDRVEIRASEDGGWIELEVADTGLGIPAEDLATVWEELARATNARGIPGSGLGLPLVRLVVERHGGTVSIRSRPGQGTSVRLRLPADPS